MKIQKPYVQTEPAVWKRQDYLLRSKEPPQDIYKVLVEESGWRILSKLIAQEPKKIKQICNRKTALTEKLQVADAGSSQPKDQLESLITSQKDANSLRTDKNS